MKYVGLHCPLLPYSLPAWNASVLGVGKQPGVVAEVLERALDQVFVAEREAAEQQRGVGSLVGGPHVLHGSLELAVDRLEADALLVRKRLFALVEKLLHFGLTDDIEEVGSVLGRGRHLLVSLAWESGLTAPPRGERLVPSSIG